MIECLARALSEAANELKIGIENNDVNDDWCATFAANLDRPVTILKELVATVTNAIGGLAQQIK